MCRELIDLIIYVSTLLFSLLPPLSPSLSPSLPISSGELLGSLCACDGVVVYQRLQCSIVEGIRDNMTRDVGVAEPELVEKLRRSSREETEDSETERVS